MTKEEFAYLIENLDEDSFWFGAACAMIVSMFLYCAWMIVEEAISRWQHRRTVKRAAAAAAVRSEPVVKPALPPVPRRSPSGSTRTNTTSFPLPATAGTLTEVIVTSGKRGKHAARD